MHILGPTTLIFCSHLLSAPTDAEQRRTAACRAADSSQLRVAAHVPRAIGSRQSQLLPPFPELRLEHLPLMRLGQLKKEVEFLGEDDVFFLLRRPPPIFPLFPHAALFR